MRMNFLVTLVSLSFCLRRSIYVHARKQMKRKPLTISDHKNAGKHIQHALTFTMCFITTLSKAYGPNHKSTKQAMKASIEINKLRSILDDLVCLENSQLHNKELFACYYPGDQCI